MVTRDPWAVMDGANRRVDAEDARVAIGALLTPGATAITARQGLRPGPGDPGKVTQTGTPGPNVQINAWQHFMSATRGAGPYIGTETTPPTVAILDIPADPTNQRNDLIITRQSDTYYADGSTVGGPIRVQGTPSGTPVDPSLAAYPDHILLGRVRVTAGATTITNSMIDDLRPGWVVALGGVLPIRTQSERDALTGWDGAVIYRIDRDWTEIHDGTAWRVQGTAVCSSTADRNSAITHPYNGQIAVTTDTGTVWLRQAGAWVVLSSGTSVDNIQNTAGTTTSTTYTTTLTGGTACGVSFTAPASGVVIIHNNSEQFNAGGLALATIQVRAGASIGSGTLVLTASDDEANFSSDDNRTGVTRRLSGLTPWASYNVQQLYRVTAGTGTFSRKSLIVQPG
ncbi:hypothetical protein SUDANB95_05524 [Actinosynnema sp. ALI-1.44]